VTFFFGVLDPGTHTLTYTNAGHNPPVVLRADGGLERLAPGGPPLGFFDGSSYRSGQVVLEPNDFIVCYSDGVTEARSPAGEDFGEQKLIDLVRAKASATPADVVSSVFDALDEFHAGTTPGDDLTLVILKRSA
jgi:sigma-B regulation protein RsbU (phosphoserine phosphatase)